MLPATRGRIQCTPLSETYVTSWRSDARRCRPALSTNFSSRARRNDLFARARIVAAALTPDEIHGLATYYGGVSKHQARRNRGSAWRAPQLPSTDGREASP